MATHPRTLRYADGTTITADFRETPSPEAMILIHEEALRLNALVYDDGVEVALDPDDRPEAWIDDTTPVETEPEVEEPIHGMAGFLTSANPSFKNEKSCYLSDDFHYFGQLNRTAFFGRDIEQYDDPDYMRMVMTYGMSDLFANMYHTNTSDLGLYENEYCLDIRVKVAICQQVHNAHLETDLTDQLTDEEHPQHLWKLGFDEDLNFVKSLPLFIDDNFVALLTRDDDNARRWILSPYTPNGLITKCDEGHRQAVPFTTWDSNIVSQLLGLTTRVINRYRGDSWNRLDNATLINTYLSEFYENSPELRIKYFNAKTEFNLLEYRRGALERAVNNLQEEFDSFQRSALTTARSLSETQINYKGLMALPDDGYMLTDEMLNNPRITAWYAINETLHFFTDDIQLKPDNVDEQYAYLVEDDGTLPIGEYRIEVNLSQTDNAESAIRMFALGGGVQAFESNMQHPHVFVGGNACFGTYINTVMDCLADFDIPTLVDVLIMFLSNCNDADSAGKYWPRWADEEADIR